jgi:hypothetical protein
VLPVRKIEKTYTTLEEIRERKEQLATDIQKDNDRFSSLWSQMFVSRKDSSKGEWISSLITNGITAVDTFLLVRKLLKNYGQMFRRKRK